MRSYFRKLACISQKITWRPFCCFNIGSFPTGIIADALAQINTHRPPRPQPPIHENKGFINGSFDYVCCSLSQGQVLFYKSIVTLYELEQEMNVK